MTSYAIKKALKALVRCSWVNRIWLPAVPAMCDPVAVAAHLMEKMRKDAESHAGEDKRKRELIDACNMADQIIYQMEKLLKDNADKISEGDKAPIKAAIEKVKQAASGEDVAAIRRSIEELQQASHAMAEHLNKQQPGGGAGGGGAGGAGAQPSGDGKGKDDVIDAEFEVKK